MPKSLDELNKLKKEYGEFFNKLKKLSNEEVDYVICKEKNKKYKYSFRESDFVYLNEKHNERFMIYVDVDTDDDNYRVEGQRKYVKSIDLPFDKDYMSVYLLYDYYKRYGGLLKAFIE